MNSSQMKLMKLKFEQWWNSNFYLKFLSLSRTWQYLPFSGRTRQGCFEIAYLRLLTGKFSKLTTVEKMDRCS